MGRISFEVSYASMVFVEWLRLSGRLGKMLHNGVDIVLFEANTGEKISVHFIDSALPLYEIHHVLTDNQSRGIATLYMLWADMMLPADHQVYVADDWMEVLYTLYQGSIYAFEIIEREAFLFPVHFRGEGLRRQAEFGTAVRFSLLQTREVTTYLAGLQGTWLIADFGGKSGCGHDAQREHEMQSVLSADYALLGLDPGVTLIEIKMAYRMLARRYHPDMNAESDASDTMRKLNAAYERLVAAVGK
ncbi:MAG: J domain-containing protein [Anaerolineae bacterium]|nr:J domain-containing protein [Anaerolineae bacterium]